jgi:hypothetical protein
MESMKAIEESTSSISQCTNLAENFLLSSKHDLQNRINSNSPL